MALLKLSQKLQQKMVLTPQLRQRIEMLQMNSIELSELIQEELVSNPMLEEVQTEDEIWELSEKILDQNADGTERGFEDKTSINAENSNEDRENVSEFDRFKDREISKNGSRETKVEEIENPLNESAAENQEKKDFDAFNEIDFGREFQDYLDPGYKTQEFEFNEGIPNFEQFLSNSKTLADHLEWQLNLQSITEDIKYAGACIIGNLDKYGRLKAANEEIAAMCNSSLEAVEGARKIIMRFDPVGCAVRDIKECLLVQLEMKGEGESLAYELVREHLENLQPNRLNRLSKATGIEANTLNREIKKVRALNPYPGDEYSSEKPVYISPEVSIEKTKGDYVIYFPDYYNHQLRISSTYRQILNKGETNKETKSFIKDKVRSAIDLLRNIEHRQRTIYRVVECIVKRQHAFLDKGVEHIKPMMLKDVAEDIGMHLSTVSRVVNRKYAHTPQGIIELRRFFSEGMLNEDGEEVSTLILKLKIRKMIEKEDSHKPLTDSKITKLLSKGGVKISRRTVAKYRDQMNISGSHERKRII